jgi:hypothetical protein
MPTAFATSLASLRLGGFHGGRGDGFGWLLLGLAAIGALVWAFSRPIRQADKENPE